MSILSRIAALTRNLFERPSVERDLDDELRAYVELLAAEKMRQGMVPAAAKRAALIEAGGVDQLKEHVRDVRAGALFDIVAKDVRFGVRSLAKTPSFTAAAVLALALGIGANTAMLSVVNGVLLRPLPYEDADRLVVILHKGRNPIAPANFVDWSTQTRSFSATAAADYWTPNLTGTDNPEHIDGLHVTASLFPMLGVRPLLGRWFTESEDATGTDPVVVMGYGLWQRRFGGDSAIVGRRISLDGRAHTVVGVMPPSFKFAPFWATRAELCAPLALGARAASRSGQSLRMFARLRPGVTVAAAKADLAAVTTRLEREFPGTNREVTVQPLKEKVVGDIRTPLVVLLVAVAFVLLIACANVAHMLLARSASRQRELAVRTALGATRARLVAQLLVESGLLAAAGGIAGVVLAMWGVRSLVAAGPSMIPRVADVSIDARVLLIALAVTATTVFAFGLIPALRSARVDLAAAFRDGDRASSEGRGRGNLRGALVASEIALALVLLIGAGLMIKSFAALRVIDPGFDPRNVVTMTISTAGTKEAEPGVRAAFFAGALARLKSIPGVGSASYINHLPIAGDEWGFSFAVEGRPKPKPGDSPVAAYRVVFPGYFAAMRIPLLRGRDISDADRAGAPKVVVVNKYLADTYWPGQDPIGKRITLDDSTWVSVVGVTKNTVREEWAAPAEEEMFLPFFQDNGFLTDPRTNRAYLTLVARASCDGADRCDAAALAAPIVRAVRDIDRNMPVSDVQTMSKVVDDATADARFYLVLLGAFAAVAVVLAAVGIYGVMSYSVARRTHEIGIRIALGAEPSSVLALVVGSGMRLTAAGTVAGVVGALALTRLMGGLLYGVRPNDPATLVVVTLALCAIALVASYVPARRATRVDPLEALRSD